MKHDGENVLIVSVNWIGDAIMAMPALQVFRQHHPNAYITVLAKSGIMPLWEVHAAPDHVEPLRSGRSGTLDTVRRLRHCGPFDRAMILPHSFRSALIPWLARIPNRIAMPGHGRDWMLSEVIPPPSDQAGQHQAYEYLHLLCPQSAADTPLPPPSLEIPAAERDQALSLVEDLGRPLITLVPGAARGPSKQWPVEHFIHVGRKLAHKDQAGIMVTGTQSEQTLCEQVAQGIGPAARVFSGRTTLKQWMALLSLSNAVIANDSGAMHVATALGIPVVAIFGITDPSKTGPLGAHSVVLQKSTECCRDVPRISSAATAALEAVQPHEVYAAVQTLLSKNGESP